MPAETMRLLRPDRTHLPGFLAALEAGWSPDTTRDVSLELRARLDTDAEAYLAQLWSDSIRPRVLADGSEAIWLPCRTFWMWDGTFCGSINLRFMPHGEELPPHVSGHVGYAVVPGKQRRGLATSALRQLLPVARGLGLRRLLITCDDDNAASRKVIAAVGGEAAGSVPHDTRPGHRKLQFWVNLRQRVADFPRPPAIEPEGRPVRIVLGGAVIAATDAAWRILETTHPPTYYLPRHSFADGALTPRPRTSFCEWKGVATYFTVAGGGRREIDAGWGYPEPSPAYAALRDHVAVYAGRMDACFVGDEQVTPQPGGFYGGWITAELIGPFKGAPGTEGW